MELTIDQALKQGVEAHKAGQITKLIVIIQPYLKHNPNILTPITIWVYWLLVWVKSKKHCPSLKTALDANPSIAQFWLSYIDALIKFKSSVADAKAVSG